MNLSNTLLIIVLSVGVITVSLLKSYIHLQTLKIIANNTSNEQFDHYLTMRIFSTFLFVFIFIYFLNKK